MGWITAIVEWFRVILNSHETIKKIDNNNNKTEQIKTLTESAINDALAFVRLPVARKSDSNLRQQHPIVHPPKPVISVII